MVVDLGYDGEMIHSIHKDLQGAERTANNSLRLKEYDKGVRLECYELQTGKKFSYDNRLFMKEF